MAKYHATRTVRGGKVRIGGVTFQPDENHMAYDGRLDGMRITFGRYWNGDEPAPVVSMTGPGNEGLVNGSYPWLFWRPV